MLQQRSFCSAGDSGRANGPNKVRKTPFIKRHFLRRLYIKCTILPRQARDKHGGNSKISGVSHSVYSLIFIVLIAGMKACSSFLFVVFHAEMMISLPRPARDRHRASRRALKHNAVSSLVSIMIAYAICEMGPQSKKKRHFLSHLNVKKCIIILPRQARDKYTGSSTLKKEAYAFS